MRTIVSGTVNGVAFSLKEDGKTVCKESKYCNLISKIAKKALDETQDLIKQGLHPKAVFVIMDDLEDCKDVKIKVNKAVEYLDETMAVHYCHVPADKDVSKMLFLKGKFKTEGSFEVLTDHTTKVYDPKGNLDKAYSNMLNMWLFDIQMKLQGYSPDKNYDIYKVLRKEIPAITTLEKACFYQQEPDPNVIY